MATPDDFKANAGILKWLIRLLKFPEALITNNFANVDLIVKLAQENRVQVKQLHLL